MAPAAHGRGCPIARVGEETCGNVTQNAGTIEPAKWLLTNCLTSGDW